MGRALGLRRGLFWLHLAAGCAAALLVLSMAATGFTLSLEPAALALLERAPAPAPAPGAPALSADELAARARAAVPGPGPDSVVLDADPSRPAIVSFGRARVVFLDPRSGAVLGEGATRARAFFRSVEDVHRFLGLSGRARDAGRLATGAAACAVLFLTASGPLLWLPRRWSSRSVRAASLPSLKGHGKARDWNWHNSAGIWAAPVLAVTMTCAVVMAFQKPAARPEGPAAGRRDGGKKTPAASLSLESLAAAARARVPGWRAMTLRPPRPGSREATAFIQGPGAPAYRRSTLALDAATGAEKRWEPAEEWGAAKRWRMLAKPVHVGEAGGAAGRTLVSLSALAALILAWTGSSLALRRLRRQVV